ncbi:MAG: hypothetical protein Q605_AUC00991G0003 [Actinomyces urogenitalis DORA_12]|uniref:Uncharacterized protein n=1 Tax=Actinomyces urogenitalis DORA_12 TaxID=1403939 RepID=W1VC31_9ACTO|nr:MAG: hypothetical protein Q605_AUC00991G0003 [Actinomyces urogenitalis DORA_12]
MVAQGEALALLGEDEVPVLTRDGERPRPCQPRLLGQQAVIVRVRVEHELPAVTDELTLAEEVILKGGVLDETDVVLTDVEEDPHVKGEAEDPLELVGLGGDLHDQVRHASVQGLAHHAQGVS